MFYLKFLNTFKKSKTISLKIKFKIIKKLIVISSKKSKIQKCDSFISMHLLTKIKSK